MAMDANDASSHEYTTRSFLRFTRPAIGVNCLHYQRDRAMRKRNVTKGASSETEPALYTGGFWSQTRPLTNCPDRLIKHRLQPFLRQSRTFEVLYPLSKLSSLSYHTITPLQL